MSLKKFSFKVISKERYARTGIINTHRGKIHTPAFMPVGTQATVKAVFIDDIIKTGSEIILANTYHLMLRPGIERIKKHSGLHKFMNCKLPILTDSGGFQVMSLSKLNKVDKEKGAIFNSHIDGKKFILSPEESIKIQKGLNSDIVMVMDECPKNTKDKNKIKDSLDLSMYWAKRSKDAFGKNKNKALLLIAVVSMVSMFCLSLAPPTDADSLRYHLGLPAKILTDGNFYSMEWFHQRVFGHGEILNLLGLIFGTDCFGSFLQFVSLVGCAYLFVNKAPKKSFFLALIICSPKSN